MTRLTMPPQKIPCQQLRRSRLGRDQSLRIWLPADSTVIAHGGALTLTEPLYWLDTQALGTQVPLADGQAHRLPRAGWVEIRSTAGAEFICVQETPILLSRRVWQTLVNAIRLGRHRTFQG